MLHALAEDLENLAPEDYRAPRQPVPEDGRKIGELDDNERRLHSMLLITEEKHKALHEETGLPFGGNGELDEGHRQLHIHLALIKMVLSESLSQTNPAAAQPGVFLCQDWGIYTHDDIFPGLGGAVQIIML
ncbi:hypothetical protein KKD95_01425 [Patescibacteria group bacterium]|nr:hypothetical protein [Patescibacteria group bacterium]